MNYVLVGMMGADGEFIETGRAGIISKYGELYFVQTKYETTIESAEEMPENLGKVIWFDPFRGLGQVLTNEGDVKVYFTVFVNNGLINPEPGSYIAYLDIGAVNKGTTDRPIQTSFALEILGPAELLKERPSAEELKSYLAELKKNSAKAQAEFRPKLSELKEMKEILGIE